MNSFTDDQIKNIMTAIAFVRNSYPGIVTRIRLVEFSGWTIKVNFNLTNTAMCSRVVPTEPFVITGDIFRDFYMLDAL